MASQMSGFAAGVIPAFHAPTPPVPTILGGSGTTRLTLQLPNLTYARFPLVPAVLAVIGGQI